MVSVYQFSIIHEHKSDIAELSVYSVHVYYVELLVVNINKIISIM